MLYSQYEFIQEKNSMSMLADKLSNVGLRAVA